MLILSKIWLTTQRIGIKWKNITVCLLLVCQVWTCIVLNENVANSAGCCAIGVLGRLLRTHSRIGLGVVLEVVNINLLAGTNSRAFSYNKCTLFSSFFSWLGEVDVFGFDAARWSSSFFSLKKILRGLKKFPRILWGLKIFQIFDRKVFRGV